MFEEKHKIINPLEPFLLLAKTTKGAAAVQLVNQVTETPGVYVFGELLQIDGIKELQTNEAYEKQWKLLQVFVFGTYRDYKENSHNLPILSELQTRKLQLLTIASLASKSKFVPYKLLQDNLDLQNMRDVEDLIIEAIYADILKGKINQKQQRLEVDFVIGRDIQPHMVDDIITTLENWCENCEKAMNTLEEQSNRANNIKEVKGIHRKNIDLQVENVRKAMKTQDLQPELDPESSSSSSQKQQRTQKFKTLKSTMKAQPARTR